MRLLVLALVVLLGSCAPVPHAVTVRHVASYRLESCLSWRPGYHPTQSQRQACLEESSLYCRDHGLEDTCAIDDLWIRSYSR